MRIRPLGCTRASALALALMSSTVADPAAQERPGSGQRETGSTSTAGSAGVGKQPGLVRIPDPVARRATVTALHTAVARFESPGCRQILLEFVDRDGRPLEARLTSMQVDIDQYVSTLVFYDGSRFATCDKGALAFTAPGSRAVHVCITELKSVQPGQPEYVIAALIHEILHTLGLGENPPSSNDITRRVLALCGR